MKLDLLLDRVLDTAIFDFPQLGVVQASGRMLLTSRFKLRRAEQAADLIGAVRSRGKAVLVIGELDGLS